MNVKTEEHYPDYQCKGICHTGMRCVDLPDHAVICTAKSFILTDAAKIFLREEIKKTVDEKWKEKTKTMLEEKETTPRKFTSCC